MKQILKRVAEAVVIVVASHILNTLATKVINHIWPDKKEDDAREDKDDETFGES